jgi:hypothetical protein
VRGAGRPLGVWGWYSIGARRDPPVLGSAMPPYSGLVLDKTAIVSAVGGVRVANSEHELFSRDSVMLRATWRFGHAVVRPNRIGSRASHGD